VQGKRLGIVLNQASVDANYRLAAVVIARRFSDQVVCLFSPQHGIWGEQQANMIETADTLYQPLGLPVYSLYCETRRPTQQMLGGIDAVIVDLQDVGTRVYTFIWTLLEVMQACSIAGKSVIVLDRPNPIGGLVVEGCPIDSDYFSFVGGARIPLRHGLTIAEMALLLKDEYSIDVDLHVVAMTGWSRGMLLEETGRRWLWPSPNMPTATTTLLYPGMVLLEGTNLSEGRGTTRPFELAGAPYVDSRRWLAELSNFDLPGLQLLPTRFKPTFDKWQGDSCQGLDIQITDSSLLRSVALAIALLATAAKLFPEFRWLNPPYEYEYHNLPIDILYGNDNLRQVAEQFRSGALPAGRVLERLAWNEANWLNHSRKFWLYR
jgi:uncharacterized protein YbbC (DUF1343 family)